MPAIINSDDGVVSGSSGLKTSGANDGITVFQQNGTESMRIDSSGNITVKDRIQFGTDPQTNIQAGGTSDVDLIVAGDTNIRFETATNERMRIDSSGNVGIGASSPNSTLNVVGAQTTFDTNVFGQVLVRSTAAYNATPRAGVVFSVKYNSAGDYIAGGSSIQCYKQTANNGEFANGLLFTTQAEGQAPAERARIDSSGNLLVGTTSNPNSAKIAVGPTASNGISIESNSTSVVMSQLLFRNPNGIVGSVTTSGSSTAYNTSSDYRLKHDIAPMTGALAKVALLKPCTYKWNVDDSAGEGFIAHELQAVVPDAVTGEKDAVDAEGNPVYQGIDTSFLVATLTAAIQELKAELDATKAEVAALKTRTT